MANPDNLQVICDHMLAYLRRDGVDAHLKTDIISRVTRLTQKYVCVCVCHRYACCVKEDAVLLLLLGRVSALVIVLVLLCRFGQDRKWHLDTVFKVLSLAGDEVPQETINNTAKVIMEGESGQGHFVS